MHRIYISGHVKGYYRTQLLIKYLLDNHFLIYYNSIRRDYCSYNSSFRRLLNFILKKIDRLILFIYNTYQISISDIVIIPAMCNNVKNELMIADIFKKKIVSDYYISFYDTFVNDRNKYPRDSQAAKRLKTIDYNLLEKSDLVFFLNNTEAKRYLQLAGLPFNEKRHKIIPLVVEEKFKCDLPYFKIDLKTDKIFNICWWGTYIPLHGLNVILKAAKILKHSNKTKFHFYLFGNNKNEAQPYQKLIQDLNVSDKVTLENDYSFNNGKLGAFLKENCDLVLGNFGDSEKAKSVIVNKIIEGIAMMAPVLTGESEAPKEFFSDNELFYTKNEPEAIADMIHDISNLNPIEIKNRTEKAFKIYLDNFSPAAYNLALSELFNDLK